MLMKEEDHLKAYQEYKDNIFSWALEIHEVWRNPREPSGLMPRGQ